MTKNIDEALTENSISKKKTSFKITRKNPSKITKKVILETPILEQASYKKNKIINETKKEVIINQNSSFFYEPSVFKKFDIEISKADEDNSEYDFISTETPDIYNLHFDTSICDNKTLVINEEMQKVYLPYTIEEVTKKLNTNSNYQSIEDVIEQEYVLPISTFKTPTVSRFKETYKLMREREKSSIHTALNLGFELMFNSNLNPAIIRASKNLKELSSYLNCLCENEPEKFDCFKIIYKVLPRIQ